MEKKTQDVLAVGYASMILQSDRIPITSDRISQVLEAAGVKIESYWMSLYGKLLQKYDLADFIKNVGGGGGAVATGAAQGDAPAEGKEEEKKEEAKVEEEEEESDSDADMGLGLFGDEDSDSD